MFIWKVVSCLGIVLEESNCTVYWKKHRIHDFCCSTELNVLKWTAFRWLVLYAVKWAACLLVSIVFHVLFKGNAAWKKNGGISLLLHSHEVQGTSNTMVVGSNPRWVISLRAGLYPSGSLPIATILWFCDIKLT